MIKLKKRYPKELDFLNEEINDLVFAIDKNDIQNNRKGGNLIYATRNFRIASIGFAFFTILIIGLSFTFKSSSQEIEIVDIKNKLIEKVHGKLEGEFDVLDYHPEIDKINQGLIEISNQLDSLNNKLLCPKKNIGHLADSANFEHGNIK